MPHNRCSDLFIFIFIGNLLSVLCYRLTPYHHRSVGVASRLIFFHQVRSPRLATMLPPWLPYAPRCAPQESHHQADEDISIGSSLYLSTGLQGEFLNFFIHIDFILSSITLVPTNFHRCNSIPAHRQRPEAQVPMPPSRDRRKGKVPRAPDHKQRARG